MTRLFIPPLAFFALAALVASILLALQRGPAALFADCASFSVCFQRLDDEQEFSTRLDATREATIRRVEARMEITQALIDGRLTLREAAACYRDLNRTAPELQEVLQRTYSGKSPDEQVCRHVLALASMLMLDWSPERAAARRVQLEFEFHQAIHADEGKNSRS